MKTTTEDLGNCQVLLTIEVDEERIQEALRDAARRVARQYNIPGFRRGRAPFHVVLQRVGREALLQESMEDLGQEVIAAAIEKENLNPYGAGELQDVQLDPLTFKIRVPLRPVVDLGDYRALRIEPPIVTVEEEEIDAELERLRQENAILEPVERPAQTGDAVTLNLDVELDGALILSRQDVRVVLEAENEPFEVGVGEQIVGMETGTDKQFELTLSDDWGQDRTGKKATFKVQLTDVKNRILPDRDDDLARTIGDFDTLVELREDIREQFEERARHQADREYSEKAIQTLVDSATIAYPPDLLEDQIDDMVEDLKKRVEARGLKMDDYLKVMGKTEDTYRESVQPQAETIIRHGLTLGELASQEGLDIEGEEIDQHIALLSASWGERAAEVREALSDAESMRSIANRLLTDKAVQRLVAIVRGEAPPLEKSEAKGDDATEAGMPDAKIAASAEQEGADTASE